MTAVFLLAIALYVLFPTILLSLFSFLADELIRFSAWLFQFQVILGYCKRLNLNKCLFLPSLHPSFLPSSAIAPPHSYIDASEFESPAALARYLKLLDSDDARFNEYFWWRDFYERSFKHHQGKEA